VIPAPTRSDNANLVRKAALKCIIAAIAVLAGVTLIRAIAAAPIRATSAIGVGAIAAIVAVVTIVAIIVATVVATIISRGDAPRSGFNRPR
jgi:enoyl-[acyl-carrier-protein] reductase (NADH)